MRARGGAVAKPIGVARGMVLGLNHPADRSRGGPSAWTRCSARSRGLQDEYREEPVGSDDVALAAYGPRAKSVRARPVARSARRGPVTERIVLRNRSRRARTYFVAVTMQPRVRDLDAAYVLRVG